MGSISYVIEAMGASPFIARWDTPVQQPLYIRFAIQALVVGAVFDITAIKSTMVSLLQPDIYESVSVARVINIAQIAILAQGGSGTTVSMELSKDNVNWRQTVVPNAIENQFFVLAVNIDITVLSYPPVTL
jgi:hypothetical protein